MSPRVTCAVDSPFWTVELDEVSAPLLVLMSTVAATAALTTTTPTIARTVRRRRRRGALGSGADGPVSDTGQLATVVDVLPPPRRKPDMIDWQACNAFCVAGSLRLMLRKNPPG